MSPTIEFAPENEKIFGPCECCGQFTRRVWGYVYNDGNPSAAYFVEWTKGHPNCQANFDLIYGKWGDDTCADDRFAIAVAFQQLETGPSFMVLDAATRPVSKNSLVGHVLSREEALSDMFRESTFATLDAIYFNDPRIGDLTAYN